jgi:hypothetical protein
MNTKEINKLNSHESTDKVLDKYNHVWSPVLAVSETVTGFKVVVLQIREMGAERAIITTGLTQTKAEKREHMIDLALIWAGSGFAYATKQKDQTLKAVFNYSFTDLTGGADNTVVDRCQAIHNQLVKLVPVMGDYQLTEAELDELLTAIKEFKDTIGEKGSSKGTKVANTQQLKQLFREADDLLRNQLDKLMLRFKKKSPEFYNAYTNARKVVDLGGGKAKKTATDILKAA